MTNTKDTHNCKNNIPQCLVKICMLLPEIWPLMMQDS
jgi:hypothetical protein